MRKGRCDAVVNSSPPNKCYWVRPKCRSTFGSGLICPPIEFMSLVPAIVFFFQAGANACPHGNVATVELSAPNKLIDCTNHSINNSVNIIDWKWFMNTRKVVSACCGCCHRIGYSAWMVCMCVSFFFPGSIVCLLIIIIVEFIFTGHYKSMRIHFSGDCCVAGFCCNRKRLCAGHWKMRLIFAD